MTYLPYPARSKGRAVFDKGIQTSTNTSTAGSGGHLIFGHMRNAPGVKPGKPIPFGERPADRPFAADLGSGADFSATFARNSPGTRSTNSPTIKPGSTMFRRAIGMALFSWEEQSPA